jgi:hypothetical protein
MERISDDLAKDLFGFAAPSEHQLNNISMWASRALELQAEIEQAELHLAGLNKELAAIEEYSLPSALLEAGLIEFKLKNGGKITISDVIQGGLSKDLEKRSFTMNWVIDQGGQEIIKDHFEIDYTKGKYDEAVKFRELLKKEKVNFDEFESIHGMTLQSFLREKLREGVVAPFDQMGLRYFKKANIKLPKKDK